MSASEPFFPDLEIDGQVFSFEHLEPFNLQVPSERVNRDLELNIRFSNHCFSCGGSNLHLENEECIITDHRGMQRVFCPIRYELSRELPDVLERMNSSQVKVWQTAERRSFSHVVQIENPVGPYYVFFELKRNEDGGDDDLKMVVESAYHQDLQRSSPNVLGRIGFQNLCSKVYLREKIRTMKKGR